MKLLDCTEAEHGPSILAIFNHAIINSTALYDYKPRQADGIPAWFDTKRKGAYPVIGAVDETGVLLGFGTYGTFRVSPGYKYTIEHSVYVHHEQRQRGLGQLLLKELISRATQQGYHVMVGGIDAENEASIRLHKKLGFSYSGTIKQAGFKFGRWLDVVFYQLTLPTPVDPKDG
jgi:L-amino acid N-acyltransferase YncA